jgi:DNA-binding NtrC family response regulator
VALPPDAPRGHVPQRTVIGQSRRPLDTLAQLRCRIIVIKGPKPGTAYDLKAGETRVGKDPSENDVVIDDPTVSRTHFTIVKDGERYVVKDLGSTNGTFVDGAQVKEAYLRPGAALEAGDVVMRFQPEQAPMQLAPSQNERFGELVGKSLAMREIFALLERIAPTDATVLLIGETGTGKGEAAKAIHAVSPRAKGPFVVVDCGAISQTLIESELFGHEKGAFTGAHMSRPGAFERANAGTIFLDELGELRLDLQPKLLRVLENREVRRVGSNKVIEVDVRVIAATNRDLAKEVAAGNFREDLYFRLSVINIHLPPLRQRRDDIPHIIRAKLADPEIVSKQGRKRFSAEAMSVLMAYSWPGNVRELMNVLSHVLTFADGDEIDVAHLPPRVQGDEKEAPLPFNEHLSFKDAKEQILETFERKYIASVLKRCGGNISRAARESGLHRKSIERLVKKYNLDARAMKAAGAQESDSVEEVDVT